MGFDWLDFHDSDNSIISFLRRGKNPDDILIFVYNFTPVQRKGYKIGVPRSGYYKEILNSNSEIYGGNNVGNSGGLLSAPIPWQGRPHLLKLILPPLGMIALKPER